MVPNGWLHKQIGEIASIQVGRDLVEDKYSEISTTEYKYPVYSNTVENKGLYGFYNFPEYSGNAITIVGRGVGLGKAFARSPGESFGAIGRLLVLTPKNNSFDVIFFANYINFALRIHNESGGIPQLPGASLSKYFVMLPPLAEQQKIAQILSTWDKAIAVTEQLLANSQQQKKALMQQLLTGKKRLLDENGVRFEGEWQKQRLGSLLKEGKERNKDNSISRVLSVTNHSGFVLPENQFSKRIASDEVSHYKVVRKGQYGYNPSRINVGSFARLDQFSEGLLSPMYVVFSIDSVELDSDFFLYWMQSNEAQQRINNSTQGSVRDSVGFDAICSFVFKMPILEEQKKISAVISASLQEIRLLETKLYYLQREKKALMQQLLTGKRRVKVAA